MNVLAIVVVYERSLSDVSSLPRLLSMLSPDHTSFTTQLRLVHLLIYDNSSIPRVPTECLELACTYIHDPSNGGTAAAYRHGAALAAKRGADWLLLVDQDTHLPKELFDIASAEFSKLRRPQPAAMLPWVMHGKTIISPARITRVGSVRPLVRNAAPDPQWPLTGIASGCFIQVREFNALDAIPNDLWLDYVDHWIFAQLSQRNAQVAVIDCVLQHDLSIRNPNYISTARLGSILQSETCFVGGMPWLARAAHPLRLLARAARMATTRPDHAVMMLRHVIGQRRNVGQ